MLTLICVAPGQVNYWPSNVQHTKEVESDRYTLTTQHVNGMAVKEDLPPVEGGIGDFRQAGDRIRDMDEGRCALVCYPRRQIFLSHTLLAYTASGCIVRQSWCSSCVRVGCVSMFWDCHGDVIDCFC